MKYYVKSLYRNRARNKLYAEIGVKKFYKGGKGDLCLGLQQFKWVSEGGMFIIKWA